MVLFPFFASSSSWVTMITAFPSIDCLNKISVTISLLSESKEPVGSSAKISMEGFKIIRASATRCFSPPDKLLMVVDSFLFKLTAFSASFFVLLSLSYLICYILSLFLNLN